MCDTEDMWKTLSLASILIFVVGCGGPAEPETKPITVTPTGQPTTDAPPPTAGKEDIPTPMMDKNAPGNETPAGT